MTYTRAALDVHWGESSCISASFWKLVTHTFQVWARNPCVWPPAVITPLITLTLLITLCCSLARGCSSGQIPVQNWVPNLYLPWPCVWPPALITLTLAAAWPVAVVQAAMAYSYLLAEVSTPRVLTFYLFLSFKYVDCASYLVCKRIYSCLENHKD